MNFWGIDPGYARLGYGVISLHGVELTYCTHGAIETEAGVSTTERLLFLERALNKLLRKYPPEAFVVEQVFIRQNLTSGVKLAEARGVVLLTIARTQKPIYEITPTALKKLLTGNGQATKKQMQVFIKKVLRLQEIPKPDDAADALALALAAYFHSQKQERVFIYP